MILGATLAASLDKQGMAFSAGVVGVMLFPARRPRVRPHRLDRRHLRREDARGRRPDGRPEPRLLRHRGPGDGRLRRRDLAGCSSTRPRPRRVVAVLPLRRRSASLTSIAFVYITQYYTEYKYRPVRRSPRPPRPARPPTSSRASRSASSARCAAGHRDLRRAPGSYCSARSASRRPAGRRPLRHRRRHHGHARRRRRTSWRWTPSGRSPTTPAASSRCRSSPRRSARRPTGSTPSATRPRRSPRATPIGSAALAAFLLFSRLPRRGQEAHGAQHIARRPRPSRAGLRRRPARRDAGLRLLRARDQGGRQGGAGRHRRGAAAVQGEPGHHGGHREARLRPLRRHRHRAARCAQMVAARARSPSARPIAVGLIFKLLSPDGQIGAEAVAAS